MKRDNENLSGVPPWQLALFVCGALLILVASFGFIGTAKGWFVEHMPLRFYADSALQLKPGLPVRMAGIKIGSVRNISLDQSGRVLVVIRVERQYNNFLHQNSQATLAKESLMGDSFVDLSVGSNDAPLLHDNDEIAYLPPTDINAVAKQMADKLDATMTELQKLLTTLNSPKGKLNSSLGNLDKLLTDMHGTRQKLDETLANVNNAASHADLQKTIDDANRVLNNANKTLNNMQGHWPFTPSDDSKK